MATKLLLCLALVLASVAARCPDGWTDYSSSGEGCYRLFTNRTLDWHNAQEFCWVTARGFKILRIWQKETTHAIVYRVREQFCLRSGQSFRIRLLIS